MCHEYVYLQKNLNQLRDWMQEHKLKSDFAKHSESLKKDFGSVLRRSRSAEINKLRQLLSAFAQRIESDDSTSLLDWVEEHRLILSKLSSDSGFSANVRKSLDEWVESCTGVVMYTQQEVCFVSQDSDSITVKSRKFVKRLGRNLSQTRTYLGNSYRHLVGKDPQPTPEWIHTVNWSLVSSRIRNVVLQELVEVLTSDLQIRREVVLTLVHLTDVLTNPSRVVEQNDALKQEISAIETRFNEGIVTDSLLETIDNKLDEILSYVCHLGTFTEYSVLTNSDRHQSEYTKLNSQFDTIQAEWFTDIQTRLSQLRIDLGFHHFMELIEKEVRAFSADVSRPFAEVVLPAVQAVHAKLIDTADDFDKEKIEKMTRASLGKKL